tara:strand:- start:548 stop:700 length:153 start_codon:yes stop_codon:yes gene_type:complete
MEEFPTLVDMDDAQDLAHIEQAIGHQGMSTREHSTPATMQQSRKAVDQIF